MPLLALSTAVAATAAALTALAAAPPGERAPARPALDLRGVPAADAALVRAAWAGTELEVPADGRFADLGSAHGGDKTVRVDRPRAALAPGGRQRFPYPRGTSVVKMAATDGAVTLIAIMRRTGAAGSAGGGWEWAEYIRGGAGEDFAPIQVPDSVCSGCHATAAEAGTDWVFSRLGPAPGG